ncbi:hypothetical protein M885DRAFT_620158 [Pelagophyceae sp. CCMP2097]|nr:hypothetical protein M885DRAFT_620158 [Pelagophyceae sp. CCMP2097]
MSVQPLYDADLATIAALAERFKRALALTKEHGAQPTGSPGQNPGVLSSDEVASYLAQLEAWVKETTAFACFTAQRRFVQNEAFEDVVNDPLSSYHFLKQTLGMMNNGQLLADLKAEAPYEDDEGGESAASRRASIEDHERQRRTSVLKEDR